MTGTKVNPRDKPPGAAMLDNDYQDISTAPRDGTVIEVMDPDCGVYPMRWNPDGFNVLASASEGVWECPGKNFTWSEDRGCGPRYWRPYKPERYLS